MKKLNFEKRGLAVLGAQWGDEGKGKIVDYLSSKVGVVARFQGGNNAGHTVVVGDQTFKMHHLPVGILYPGVKCVLGNGMVINPEVLINELEGLQQRGVDTSELRISDRAHVIMPFHRDFDSAEENFRGKQKIGTTGLGIGPAYADKAYRRGLRMIDFIDLDRFTSWLEEILPLQNAFLSKIYGLPGYKKEDLLQKFAPLGEKLSASVTDTSLFLREQLNKGEKVIFEGAQGALLDLDHGSYPYVTSSPTSTGGILTGLGVGPQSIKDVLGVVKAYTTRVGEGPFPTEEDGETGKIMREQGVEYGTTTGRPRRCGWFDGVIAGYGAGINGFTGWALTKLDVLTGFKTLKLATSYQLADEQLNHFPPLLSDLHLCKPNYLEIDGWEEDITRARKLDELPTETRNYLQAIEDVTKVPVVMVSTGPEREQTIVIRKDIP